MKKNLWLLCFVLCLFWGGCSTVKTYVVSTTLQGMIDSEPRIIVTEGKGVHYISMWFIPKDEISPIHAITSVPGNDGAFMLAEGRPSAEIANSLVGVLDRAQTTRTPIVLVGHYEGGVFYFISVKYKFDDLDREMKFATTRGRY